MMKCISTKGNSRQHRPWENSLTRKAIGCHYIGLQIKTEFPTFSPGNLSGSSRWVAVLPCCQLRPRTDKPQMKESTPKGPNDAVTGSEILEYISDKKIAKIVTFLGVVASFILFIPAVWGIEKIESLNGKLGALTGFVILFSLVVIMLSKAERIEVISATALYAAVLIVLVGKG
jgi:hypothetical protein